MLKNITAYLIAGRFFGGGQKSVYCARFEAKIFLIKLISYSKTLIETSIQKKNERNKTKTNKTIKTIKTIKTNKMKRNETKRNKRQKRNETLNK